MTYQEFKENVTTAIQARLGSSVKVTIQEIIKNNDTHYDGCSFSRKMQNVFASFAKTYFKNRKRTF